MWFDINLGFKTNFSHKLGVSVGLDVVIQYEGVDYKYEEDDEVILFFLFYDNVEIFVLPLSW